MGNTCWILVADAGRARLFDLDPHAQLRELRDFINVESRMACRPRSTPCAQRRGGPRRLASAPAADALDALERAFADMLADVLRDGLRAGRYRHLVLVCPPAFLDLLRPRLEDAVADAIVAKVPRDPAAPRQHELLDALPPMVFSNLQGSRNGPSFPGVP